MRVHQLRIEHFRGIESMAWKINRRLIALVGAGDSTKTTLLDAIGLVLSPSHTRCHLNLQQSRPRIT